MITSHSLACLMASAALLAAYVVSLHPASPVASPVSTASTRVPKRPPKRASPRHQVLRECAALAGAFLERDDWQALFQLADLYRKGRYPWVAPDDANAVELFKLFAMCPDPELAGLAQVRYMECLTSPIAREDVAGPVLPGRYAARCARYAHTLEGHAPRPKLPSTYDHTPPIQHPKPLILSDSQNVHDHSIVTHLRAAVEPQVDDTGYDAVYAQTLGAIDSHPDDVERENAQKVLDSLSESAHSQLQYSERQALRHTWNAIQDLPTSLRPAATETFVKQLASGVEDGHVVCSTGKIARIVGALDGIAPNETPLRPMWAVRQELGSLAASVRNAGETAETFKDRAKDMYVRELGMNPTVLDPIVEEFALGFDET